MRVFQQRRFASYRERLLPFFYQHKVSNSALSDLGMDPAGRQYPQEVQGILLQGSQYHQPSLGDPCLPRVLKPPEISGAGHTVFIVRIVLDGDAAVVRHEDDRAQLVADEVSPGGIRHRGAFIPDDRRVHIEAVDVAAQHRHVAAAVHGVFCNQRGAVIQEVRVRRRRRNGIEPAGGVVIERGAAVYRRQAIEQVVAKGLYAVTREVAVVVVGNGQRRAVDRFARDLVEAADEILRAYVEAGKTM